MRNRRGKNDDLDAENAAHAPLTARHARGATRIGKAILPQDTGAAVDLNIEVLVGIDTAEQVWREFEVLADRTVFQGFDWLAEWYRCVGRRKNVTPVTVVGRSVGGASLFLLPLGVEDYLGARRLTWLGCELCDYNAPLLAFDFSDKLKPDQFGTIWKVITDRIRGNPLLRFDFVELQKLPEMIGAQRNPFLQLPVLRQSFSAHIATLKGDWAAFYASRRSSAGRKRDRWQLRKLEGRGGIQFVCAQDRDDIRRTIEELILRKRLNLRRIGMPDIFARSGNKEFYNAVLTNPRLQNNVHISRLDVGGTTVAAAVGLQFRKCYHLLITSYVAGDLSRFSPGRAHLRHLLKYSIDAKMDKFDFTIGDEAYKLPWCDIELRLFRYLEPVTIKGRCIVVLRRIIWWTEARVRRVSPLRWLLSNARKAILRAWHCYS